jgi:cell division protein FtsZ
MRKRCKRIGHAEDSEIGYWACLGRDEQDKNSKHMIQLSKTYSVPKREKESIPVKVIGVGGSGSNALDRILLDGLESADLVAINTDVQSLASSVVTHKVQLGRKTTRGLGAGGDPDLGYQAALESTDEIRQAISGGRVILVCAGLGGGTGSGAAPVVAQLAREAGLLVVAFATMPFSFEGKRRSVQAQDALARLNEIANVVICFENDRMGDTVAPRAGIHQAFAMADITISQSVRAIVNLLQRPGLIRLGFDDLLSTLRSQNGRCLFGFGESDSDNRAHDALAHALKNPLMDKGRLLANAAHVLVQVAGGPAMTLSEVEILMKELGRYVSERTQILFGTAVDARMGNRLSVTIISALGTEPLAKANSLPSDFAGNKVATSPASLIADTADETTPAPTVKMPSPKAEVSQSGPASAASKIPDLHPQADMSPEPEPPVEPEPPLELISVEPAALAEESVAPPAPPIVRAPESFPTMPKKKPTIDPELLKPAKPEKIHAKQEVLQFEPVTRGRFEKSEPTIVEGQDLDVPTFLRKKIRVK